MYNIERIQNHIIDMYKRGIIEQSEFNALLDIINEAYRNFSELLLENDMLKRAFANAFNIDD